MLMSVHEKSGTVGSGFWLPFFSVRLPAARLSEHVLAFSRQLAEVALDLAKLNRF